MVLDLPYEGREGAERGAYTPDQRVTSGQLHSHAEYLRAAQSNRTSTTAHRKAAQPPAELPESQLAPGACEVARHRRRRGVQDIFPGQHEVRHSGMHSSPDYYGRGAPDIEPSSDLDGRTAGRWSCWHRSIRHRPAAAPNRDNSDLSRSGWPLPGSARH